MYQLNMKVKDEHIDFQNIVDDLYYPFYMEECRHKYVKDVIGVDVVEYANNGLNLVLTDYSIKFRASLKKADKFIVDCQIVSYDSKVKFAFDQKIICNNKVIAEATFYATCVKSSGGRPFIPDEISDFVERSIIKD